jgi:hypothetical protein
MRLFFNLFFLFGRDGKGWDGMEWRVFFVFGGRWCGMLSTGAWGGGGLERGGGVMEMHASRVMGGDH